MKLPHFTPDNFYHFLCAVHESFKKITRNDLEILCRMFSDFILEHKTKAQKFDEITDISPATVLCKQLSMQPMYINEGYHLVLFLWFQEFVSQFVSQYFKENNL